MALNTIVEQIADQHKNELEDLVQTGVIDLTLTKEFVSENISMLLPGSQQVYEVNSQEYSENYSLF